MLLMLVTQVQLLIASKSMFYDEIFYDEVFSDEVMLIHHIVKVKVMIPMYGKY